MDLHYSNCYIYNKNDKYSCEVKCKVLAKIHVVIDFSLIVGSDWLRSTVGNLFHSLDILFK